MTATIAQRAGLSIPDAAVVRGNHLYDGIQVTFAFPNGYGASVVRHSHSYGGRSGMFELAVLDSTGNLTYDTPITGDVLGWLTPEEVDALLARIATL